MLTQEIGDLTQDLRVMALVLDRFGFIVSANEQWKHFAETSQFELPRHGIGANYLRHFPFIEPVPSLRVISGLSQLMSGKIDRLAVVLPREGGTRRTWFLLLAFPHTGSPGHIIVLHIDITIIVSIFATYQRGVEWWLPEGAEAQPGESAISALTESASKLGQPGGLHKDSLPKLAKRQTDVLALMIKGMSNAEIANHLGLSLNTVKVHVSAILTRLGLRSRAQVLHWALAHHKDTPS